MCTGLEANASKSQIIMAVVVQDDSQELMDVTMFPLSTL